MEQTRETLEFWVARTKDKEQHFSRKGSHLFRDWYVEKGG